MWVQAPDHVIDNARALAKAGDDPKARRKATKTARTPEGFVQYDEAAMQRLVTAGPEPLVSRFRVTADLVAGVLSRPDGPAALKHLLRTNHDPEPRRRDHQRRAIAVYRSLEAAGVAERLRDADGRCLGVRVGSLVEGEDERSALRFSAPLMTFAIEVIATLDRDDPAYVVDVVSVVESVLDDPRQVLQAQQNAARTAEIARLKAEGVPYEERIERLDPITWPKPLAELLDVTFATYREHHPWMTEEPSPKSIVREMLEGGDTFATFVRRYRLERSEGLVLRYLTDAWRTLDRSLTDDVYTPALEDVVEWLGELIRATDATLLDEWTLLAGRPVHDHLAPEAPEAARPWPPAAWRTAVRTAAFGWVELLATRAYPALAERSGWDEDRLAEAMAPYWAEYDGIGTDADARSTAAFTLTRGARPLGRHATAGRPGRRRRVALRRRRRPRAGRRTRARRPCGSSSSGRSDRSGRPSTAVPTLAAPRPSPVAERTGDDDLPGGGDEHVGTPHDAAAVVGVEQHVERRPRSSASSRVAERPRVASAAAGRRRTGGRLASAAPARSTRARRDPTTSNPAAASIVGRSSDGTAPGRSARMPANQVAHTASSRSASPARPTPRSSGSEPGRLRRARRRRAGRRGPPARGAGAARRPRHRCGAATSRPR